MNSFPLKEKVSKLQKVADTEPIIEDENQSSKKLDVSKNTLVFISLGFLSITVSLSITLGVIIQKYNQEVKIQENNANFIQEFLHKHQNDTIVKILLSEALFQAVESDNLVVTEALIKSGANVTAKNDLYESPIHYASSSEMIKLLIDLGADPIGKQLIRKTLLLLNFLMLFFKMQKK